MSAYLWLISGAIAFALICVASIKLAHWAAYRKPPPPDARPLRYYFNLAIMILLAIVFACAIYVALFDNDGTIGSDFALFGAGGLILTALAFVAYLRGADTDRVHIKLSIFGTHLRLVRDVAWWTAVITWLILLAWNVTVSRASGLPPTRDALEFSLISLVVSWPMLDAILRAVSRGAERSVVLFHELVSKGLLVTLRVLVAFCALFVLETLHEHEYSRPVSIPWRDLSEAVMLGIMICRFDAQRRLQRLRWRRLLGRPIGASSARRAGQGGT